MEALLALVAVLALGYLVWIVAGYGTGGDPFYWTKPKVHLLFYDGRIITSHYSVQDGLKITYHFPMSKIAEMVMNDDGTTYGCSYIVAWSLDGKFTDAQHKLAWWA